MTPLQSLQQAVENVKEKPKLRSDRSRALLEGRAETEAGECPVCQGRGETVEQHPRTGEPTQVQCDPCYGTGKLPVEPSEVPRSLIEEAILVLDGAGDALGRFNGFQAEKCWPMAAKLRAALTKLATPCRRCSGSGRIEGQDIHGFDWDAPCPVCTPAETTGTK